MHTNNAKKSCVIVPNQPGMLKKACEILAQESVNVDCVLTEAFGDAVCFRMTLSMADSARKRVESEGFQVIEDQMFHLDLPDMPGEFNKLIAKLAQKDVCVRYVSAMTHGKTCSVVMAVDKPERATAVIGEYAPRKGTLATA